MTELLYCYYERIIIKKITRINQKKTYFIGYLMSWSTTQVTLQDGKPAVTHRKGVIIQVNFKLKYKSCHTCQSGSQTFVSTALVALNNWVTPRK